MESYRECSTTKRTMVQCESGSFGFEILRIGRALGPFGQSASTANCDCMILFVIFQFQRAATSFNCKNGKQRRWVNVFVAVVVIIFFWGGGGLVVVFLFVCLFVCLLLLVVGGGILRLLFSALCFHTQWCRPVMVLWCCYSMLFTFSRWK